MYREIKVGGKSIPMLANGATPIRYRQAFGSDILVEFQKAEEEGGAIVASSISQLGYIMAKAAEKADMSNLNIDTYTEWLEQFEPLDLAMATEDIIGLYMGNAKTTSEVKKKARGAVKDN